MKKWKLLDSKDIFSSPWITLKKNVYDIGDGKRRKDFYHIDRPDYVLIIAKTEKEDIILHQRYRRGADEIIYELPAGWIEDGESPEKAAERELEEETGMKGQGQLLGKLYAQPGFMNMTAYVVLVELKSKGTSNRAADETHITYKFSSSKVRKMLHKNEVLDMGSVAALHIFFSSIAKSD